MLQSLSWHMNSYICFNEFHIEVSLQYSWEITNRPIYINEMVMPKGSFMYTPR